MLWFAPSQSAHLNAKIEKRMSKRLKELRQSTATNETWRLAVRMEFERDMAVEHLRKSLRKSFKGDFKGELQSAPLPRWSKTRNVTLGLFVQRETNPKLVKQFEAADGVRVWHNLKQVDFKLKPSVNRRQRRVSMLSFTKLRSLKLLSKEVYEGRTPFGVSHNSFAKLAKALNHAAKQHEEPDGDAGFRRVLGLAVERRIAALAKKKAKKAKKAKEAAPEKNVRAGAMRLSADMIARSPAFFNAMKDRELDLRGNKIAVIENLAATQDQFDSLDLSDNEIRKLECLAVLPRIKMLLFNNNQINRVAENLGRAFPNLQTLVLTNNRFATLKELEPLAALPSLTMISLVDNPVTKQPHYRAFLIAMLPNLKVLDFQKVKPPERAAAEATYGSAAKRQKTAAESSAAKTFEPGAQLGGRGCRRGHRRRTGRSGAAWGAASAR